MIIDKNSTVSEINKTIEKAVLSKTSQTIQTPKQTASVITNIPKSVSSLINSLGLPADKLSASILSFARFFSLPLKPQLMADIRQQALTQIFTETQTETKQAPQSSLEVLADKIRQTFALAAAAAESKGVELQPKGLEAFAEAVDPDLHKRQDENKKNDQRKKNQESKDFNTIIKNGVIDPSGLKKFALETADENPLLYVMNRLPGKNNHRWIVLPFNFSSDGTDFHVSMRILLDKTNNAAMMALDILESRELETGNTVERKNLFVIESANDLVMKLSFYSDSEYSEKDKLLFINELSSLLAISKEKIFIKNRYDNFPYEAGLEEELLKSVDEAV